MQPQEQIISAPTALSWIGAEFTSILQLLFFLILGYTATRSWMWSRKHSRKALAKKIDDPDDVPEEIQGTLCTESDVATAVKSKATARHSNAAARKNKKMKEVAPKKDELSADNTSATPEPAPVLLEKEPQELPEQHIQQCLPEHKVESPHTLTDLAEDTATQVSERVAKMMAKKAQRKAKKAQEQIVAEEQTAEEEKCHPVAGVDLDDAVEEPAVEVPVEAEREVQATTSIIQNDETPVGSIAVVPEKVEDDMKENMQDNTETDAHSDSDEVHSSLPDGIVTPEPCLTPPLMNTDPTMWCGAGVPQIEGWMAIAVPAEYAPAGAPGPFDGLWKNQADERIVVDHEEILFESGMKWVMQMLSLTSFSVTVGDEVFTAEMDATNQRLLWSDGDIWSCVGQTDGQQRWAAEREAMGMPGVLVDGEQLFPMSPMNNMDDTEQMVAQDQMMMMMPVPQNQLVPEDAGTWEVCWDWSKKGWCPRGHNCDWYHPVEPQQQFENCQPCNYAAQFEDFDAPAGDIF